VDVDRRGVRDLCESAEKFCRECKQAVDGNYTTFPKLSYYVDAMMRASKQRDAEKMEFVKTSDGLTKVVFSSKVEDALDLDAIPAAPIRKASIVDEQTHLTGSIEIPIATPITDVSTVKGEVLQEKEPVLASRVICPGRSIQCPTKRAMHSVSGDTQSVSHVTLSLVESRVIGKNGFIFDHSSSIPVSNGCLWHGHLEDSVATSSAALPNLSRPMPLARFGSNSSGQVLPSDAPFGLPASIPPYTDNKHGPAVVFKSSKNGNERFHNGNSFHGSVPYLDPSVFSGGMVLNGKNQVYPSLRPAGTDVSAHATGGYFVPSISDALKEAVKPNVPFMQSDSPTATVNHSRFSDESKFALMNILEWVKSGASLQSFTRDARHLKSQNGQT